MEPSGKVGESNYRGGQEGRLGTRQRVKDLGDLVPEAMIFEGF